MYSPKIFSPHEVDFPIFDLSRSARHTSTSTLGPILKPLRSTPSYMRIPNVELQEHTRAIPRSILLTSTGKIHRDLWKLYAAFDQIYTNDSISYPEAILNPTLRVRTCVPPPFFLVIGNGQVTVEKTKTPTFYRIHCPLCILTNCVPIDKKIDFNTKLFLVQQPPYWMIPVDVRGPWYANFGVQLAQELVKKLRRTRRFLGLLIAGMVATIALIASATVSVVSLHENAQTAEHVNELARNVTIALDAQKRIDEKIEAQIEALKEAVLYLGDQFVVLKTITQLTCHDAYKHICVTPLPFNGSWENVRMHLQGVWNHANISLDLLKLQQEIDAISQSMLYYEDPSDLAGEILNPLNGFNPFNSLKHSFWIFLALIIGLILMYAMFACFCKKFNNQLNSSKAQLHFLHLKNIGGNVGSGPAA
ncbi:unnamed protein product [Nyctereutes procyonoides]|uniref:(raccoon dog) hypothetical protein n=1 Tax=Nyctereutes procyonoides TaxID=34880 RepID=A0A811Z6P7_NYCPR|nr:unnamed protein product [Nyctereutes procyonoides]